MSQPRRAGLWIMFLVLPASAWAAPPRLTGTAPYGVQRGKMMEVTFRGSDLADHPRLVAPFVFQVEESAGSGSGASNWRLRLSVDPRTAVGVYPIRIATDSGISNPLLFAVGQVPQISEVEPNNAPDGAETIPNPCVVEGECSGNDEDFFRFQGRKGARVVVDALCSRIGSGVDPTIRLTTAEGQFVASSDDSPGLLTDCYLTAILPEDGEYILGFCDSRYAGAGRAIYRLLVGAIPFAGEVAPMGLPRGQIAAIELRGGTITGDRLFALRTTSDPALAMFSPSIPARLLDDPAWAHSDLDVELPTPIPLLDGVSVLEPADPAQDLPPLRAPLTILGRISQPGERDEFTIKAPPGSKYEVRIEAWGLGSALDGQLRILGKDGRLLGESDDGKGRPRRRAGGGGRTQAPVSTDPAFDLTMPSGEDEVRIVVKDLMDRGGVGFPYRLVVETAEAAFTLTTDGEHVAIPRGGTALIPVTATRKGYAGPIDLEIRGLPTGSGVTAIPGTIPAGQTTGLVALKADPTTHFDPRDIQVVGRGRDGQMVAASRTIVFAEQTISTPGFGMAGTIPSYWRPFHSLTAAIVRPGPIALKPGAAKVAVSQGSTVDVPIEIVRGAGDRTRYQLVALSPPTGLSFAATEIGEGTTQTSVKIGATKDAAPGPVALGLVANPSGPKDERPRPGATAPSPSSSIAATLVTVEIGPPRGSK